LHSFVFFFFHAGLFAQASQKMPQIMTLPKGVIELHIQVSKDQVEIVKTKGSRISVETKVKINQGSLPLLKYLMDNGRYDLEAHSDVHLNTLTISPPNNKKVILVKGAECEETIMYKIHVPESVEFIKTLHSSNNRTVSL
jgi:hypothetical protein